MTNTLDASLAVVILAAGQGTRMRSALPKVLHRIGGRPLVGHVLDTARDLAPAHVLVVVRHQRDQVAEAVTGISPEVVVVDQDEIPGTGRAVEVALAAVPDFDGDVLVLSGDVPLTQANTLQALLDAAGNDKMALLTVTMPGRSAWIVLRTVSVGFCQLVPL